VALVWQIWQIEIRQTFIHQLAIFILLIISWYSKFAKISSANLLNKLIRQT